MLSGETAIGEYPIEAAARRGPDRRGGRGTSGRVPPSRRRRAPTATRPRRSRTPPPRSRTTTTRWSRSRATPRRAARRRCCRGASRRCRSTRSSRTRRSAGRSRSAGASTRCRVGEPSDTDEMIALMDAGSARPGLAEPATVGRHGGVLARGPDAHEPAQGPPHHGVARTTRAVASRRTGARSACAAARRPSRPPSRDARLLPFLPRPLHVRSPGRALGDGPDPPAVERRRQDPEDLERRERSAGRRPRDHGRARRRRRSSARRGRVIITSSAGTPFIGKPSVSVNPGFTEVTPDPERRELVVQRLGERDDRVLRRAVDRRPGRREPPGERRDHDHVAAPLLDERVGRNARIVWMTPQDVRRRPRGRSVRPRARGTDRRRGSRRSRRRRRRGRTARGVAAASASRCPRTVTSHARRAPRHRARGCVETTASSRSRRRAASTTRAPARANRSAVASPMPEEAPVTTTTAPRRSHASSDCELVSVCPPSTTSVTPVDERRRLRAQEQRGVRDLLGPAPSTPSGSPTGSGARRRGRRVRSSFIGVSIHPGASAFTRTPFGAHSSATDFVRFTIAAFAVP